MTMFLTALFGSGCVDFLLGPMTRRLEYSQTMPRKMELPVETESEEMQTLLTHPKFD
jgi:hypothetical protein